MAELRQLVASLGHADVATYIQTGNIIFTPSHDDSAVLARELQHAIADAFDVRSTVVVLTRAELAAVVSASPYSDEPNPRFVHGVFLQSDPDSGIHERVEQAVAQVAETGSRDEAIIIGRTLYLHTPDGFGTSDLARELLLKQRTSPLAAGTARNWATITKLLALCDG